MSIEHSTSRHRRSAERKNAWACDSTAESADSYLRIAVSCEPAGCIYAVTTAAAPLRILGKHHVASCRIRERRRRTVASPATAKHGMVTGVWSV
jgi:hypothetical protein